MKKLKSIEPFSLAKMLAVVDGATGLLVAAALLVVKNVPAAYQLMSSTTPIGTWMLVAIPLSAAAAGFLKGFVGAYLYNYVASKIGPVKLDIA